jgi:hypothetical protein
MSSLHSVQTASRTNQPLMKSVSEVIHLTVKRPDCEPDHSSPFNAEVNVWSHTYSLPIRFLDGVHN